MKICHDVGPSVQVYFIILNQEAREEILKIEKTLTIAPSRDPASIRFVNITEQFNEGSPINLKATVEEKCNWKIQVCRFSSLFSKCRSGS